MSHINPFEDITSRLDKIEELILSIDTSKESTDTLSLAQAAEVCQISTSRMYELSRKELIPCSRIGSRYVFIKSDLLAWLREQTIK